MKTLIVLISLLFASTAYGAPFLVCDPQAGVTEYQLTGPAWVPAVETAELDGSIKLNLAGSDEGTNTLTIKACKDGGVWGMLCSDPVPFDFDRPGLPDTPGGIVLSN